ncbi:hypothetical protein FNV43_RR24898 [Rhamnella rubrinervis]|uniref:Transposase (putative) gypsy type domain-containing protein n=1 Tax=Rhamnella rubrinervis TaxID=2594499 RepID=A0A8K0GTM1_9ROSA|nr:hypothetical protein FNV43_RR24898 [Rhamnella rubrinervis]
MRRTLVLHEPKWPCTVFWYAPCVLALLMPLACMSDGSSSNKEVYEYGGSDAEYSSDSDGIDGFAIIDNMSSIKIAEQLKRFLHLFSMDPSVTFRVADRDDDTSRPKAREAVFLTAFFDYGLRLPLLPVFREILHKWGLAPRQLTPNSWRSLVCCYILWKELGMSLTAEEFMYMYHLKKDPKRSNLRFKEVSSGLYSRIEFAKNQPTINRSYKNLLRKVDTYFSREALFGEGNLTHPTMTMEGMKKKLSEMRKSGVGEKRVNDGSEGSQSKKSKSLGLSLPPLTPSSLPSGSLTPTGPSGTSKTHIIGSSLHVSDSSPAQVPDPSTGSGYSIGPPSGSSFGSPTRLSGSCSSIPPAQLLSTDTLAQTLEGSSSSISMSVPLELSYFAKCSTKILSPAAINEMEAISSDVQASLLTTLGVKRVTISELEERARCSDVDSKLKEDTIQKLQDNLSKSESRIKELESDVIESEETNKKKIKDLENTMIQLEEKNAKALQELKSLKFSTDKTIETEVAQQLNACLSQIEHRYPALDLSWVYEVEVLLGGTGTGDTHAGGIDGVEDPAT